MQTIDYTSLPSRTGEQFGPSKWSQITQDEVNRFAQLTGDRQWIHVDVARAEREAGGTIAHGLLIISFIPYLRDGIVTFVGQGRMLNYGFDSVRFISAVKVGKKVRLWSTLLDARPRSGGIRALFEHQIEIERETKPACVARMITLFLPQSGGECPSPKKSLD